MPQASDCLYLPDYWLMEGKLKCASLTESRRHGLKLMETETCGITGQSTREEGAMQRKSPRKLLGLLGRLLLHTKLPMHMGQLHRAKARRNY